MFNMCAALGRVCAKMLYEHHPSMSPNELLSFRSIISFAVNIIHLNTGLKHEMWDSVSSDKHCNLVAKTI